MLFTRLALGFCLTLTCAGLALADEPTEVLSRQDSPLIKPLQVVPLKESVQAKLPGQHDLGLRLNLVNQRVFGQSMSVLLSADREIPSGLVTLILDDQRVKQVRTAEGQRVLLPKLALSPGKHRFKMSFQADGIDFQSSEYTLYNLGIDPPDHTYVVVDKYNFALYWVENNRLKSIYPIATGRPRTPTVPGFWLVGQKETMPNPNTGWGVKRLKIFRENEYQTHWSGYAVHGTNQPPSIGTEASHGCVRMLNQDVTQLWQEIPLGTPVVIEEHLKVYIDEI